MLFNFTLAPVEKIQPWGTPGNLSLSWFGLTDGQYWIQAGESVLFEYSEHVRTEGEPRYCDYQVVRLYEDLLEMLPYVLEPIPPSLVQYISGDTAVEWQNTYELWFDQNEDPLESDQFWSVIEATGVWSAKRRLDTLYLSPSANIVIWSNTENVYFEWDNRKKVIDDKSAWTAIQGKYKLSRAEFNKEVQSFHSRLMDQMTQRVEQVLSGALSKEINIDLDGLKKEHEQRCRSLDKALSFHPQTNWQAVEQAINDLIHANRRQGD
ncbi:MAG TPA: DUF5984 family protein [Burkholderiaceae bacterium]|jgi:hypothetical protein